MVPHVCNVLLVDDAENDRLLLKIAFEQAEPKSLSLLKPLSNGAEAIAYLAGRPPFDDRHMFPYPDMLVLDLKMPLKNGFEVLEWIRTQASRPVVVILSDSSQKADKDRAFALGAADYCVKPGGLPELVALISRFEDIWRRVAHGRVAPTLPAQRQPSRLAG